MASLGAGTRGSGPTLDVAGHSIRKVATQARTALEHGSAAQQGQCATNVELKECNIIKDECPGCEGRRLETDGASW